MRECYVRCFNKKYYKELCNGFHLAQGAQSSFARI